MKQEDNVQGFQEVAASGKPGLRWGVCAVAIPRESYYWLSDWIDHHLRAGADRVTIYDNTGTTGSMNEGSIFHSGKYQKALKSKRDEEYGKLTAALSDEDVQRNLREIAASFGDDRVRIVDWRPRNPETGEIVHQQVEAYDDYIGRNIQDVDWCAFIDMDEYLYCRPGLSVGNVLRQVESDWPEASILRIMGWRFECRWSETGPKDITSHLRHRKIIRGGEKNFLKICDVVKAGLHWYWTVKPGRERVCAHPEDFAFCHYCELSRELDKESEQTIVPRAFLSEPVKKGEKIGTIDPWNFPVKTGEES